MAGGAAVFLYPNEIGEQTEMIETSHLVEPLLVTQREAAKRLMLCEKTIYSAVKAGELPCVRIGKAKRFTLEDLKNWIARKRQVGYIHQ
jgi:excisionase family DNA binding protein